MSFLQWLPPPRTGCTLTALACALLLLPTAGDAEAGVFRPLPDVEVRSLMTSEDVGLARELAGRPAVLLLVDGSGPASCPLSEKVADLQRDFAPWFSWVAVLSGPFTIADLERVRAATPVRLERHFLDRAGELRTSLAIERLPALLLVDERGVVREICPADADGGRLSRIAGTLEALAAQSRRRTAGGEDFRLPLVSGGGMVSFLDVAGRDGTMVAFLQSRCLACARELEVLDFVHEQTGGGISFVAVFIDPAAETRIRGFLGASGANPDFVLRDPEFKLGRRYGITSAPSLLVIDRGGRVVASRTGYREQEGAALRAELAEAFVAAAAATARESEAVAEAKRLHAEACALLREGKAAYALFFQQRIAEILPGYPSVQLRIAEAAMAAGERDVALSSLRSYLASEPQPYDGAEVRETMASLLTAPR